MQYAIILSVTTIKLYSLNRQIVQILCLNYAMGTARISHSFVFI